MQTVRVYEIPRCKMVASPCGMFGEPAFEAFSAWMETLPKTTFPQDFLWLDEAQGGFIWYYV